MNDPAPEPDDWKTCLDVLRRLQQTPGACSAPGSPAGEVAVEAARLMRSLKAYEKAERKQRDREVIESAGIRERRERRNLAAQTARPALPAAGEVLPPETVSPPAVVSAPRKCYICKEPYRELHHFYDLLCRDCGDFNFARRTQSADLTGQTALVTGGRIKIGFQIALKLLRAGARVLITSRFPSDAALRFSREPDFPDWADRLRIYSADFRCLPLVEHLARQIASGVDRLDILINNAAQTVRRPPAFYRHLVEAEAKIRAELPRPALSLVEPPLSREMLPTRQFQPPEVLEGSPPAALMTQWPVLPGDVFASPEEFPPGTLDADGQQIDRRPVNSWVERLADVSLGELIEVHAVNCLAPYILIGCLEPLLEAPPAGDRFIINVSAMEGKFHAKKTGFHPHTNMAKAAMNMITRTASARYARRRIYMNSVDTGWITNEFPFQKTRRMAEDGFQPPLDEIDGAARVLDPIFTGRNTGQPIYGKFFKDYREVSW